MKLYFIGGASGSGKTAVMPNLKEMLGDNISVYDFDDMGVPEGELVCQAPNGII